MKMIRMTNEDDKDDEWRWYRWQMKMIQMTNEDDGDDENDKDDEDDKDPEAPPDYLSLSRYLGF